MEDLVGFLPRFRESEFWRIKHPDVERPYEVGAAFARVIADWVESAFSNDLIDSTLDIDQAQSEAFQRYLRQKTRHQFLVRSDRLRNNHAPSLRPLHRFDPPPLIFLRGSADASSRA